MTPTIAIEDPLGAEGRALIRDSDAAMRAAFPPEECFTFSPEELAHPDTCFFVARQGRANQNAGAALGCVALVVRPDYGEVKRLLVRPAARGQGVGRALMTALEREARARALPAIRLETGPALKAAMALYTRLGYRPCPAFGGYPDIPTNAFLEKRLG